MFVFKVKLRRISYIDSAGGRRQVRQLPYDREKDSRRF